MKKWLYADGIRGVAMQWEQGWVQNEDYERAVMILSCAKEEALTEAESDEERKEVMDQWPWDDVDEEMNH